MKDGHGYFRWPDGDKEYGEYKDDMSWGEAIMKESD